MTQSISDKMSDTENYASAKTDQAKQMPCDMADTVREMAADAKDTYNL